MPKPVALITGASSGIGRAFAEVFAAEGYDLVITARRESRLEELAEELTEKRDCSVVPIAVDLTTMRGAQNLFTQVEEARMSVDVLVNNAGASMTSPFVDTPRSRIQDMANLNVRALTELTSLFLPTMVEKGAGRILNVASVTSFRAVPGMSVYSASKAYVLSFTESLSEELKDSGVTVTALCPGLTRTETLDDLVHGEHIPPFLMSEPDAVAREGFDALMRGEVIRVPGQLNQSLVTWLEMQPRWLVRMMTGFAARASFSRS